MVLVKNLSNMGENEMGAPITTIV